MAIWFPRYCHSISLFVCVCLCQGLSVHLCFGASVRAQITAHLKWPFCWSLSLPQSRELLDFTITLQINHIEDSLSLFLRRVFGPECFSTDL